MNCLQRWAVGVLRAGVDVGLDADGIDGDAALLHAADEREDGGAFCRRLLILAFDVVVVVGEEGVRVDAACGAEGDVDVVGEELLPGRVAHAVGQVVGDLDGFVDDVPAVDAAFVAPGDGFDVVDEDLLGVLRCDVGREPRGKSAVPDEVVAAHIHAVLLGEVNDGVGVVEEEGGGLRMDGAELELVFGDEDAHLLLDERGVVGLLAESLGVDAAADEQAAGGGGGL